MPDSGVPRVTQACRLRQRPRIPVDCGCCVPNPFAWVVSSLVLVIFGTIRHTIGVCSRRHMLVQHSTVNRSCVCRLYCVSFMNMYTNWLRSHEGGIFKWSFPPAAGPEHMPVVCTRSHFVTMVGPGSRDQRRRDTPHTHTFLCHSRTR